MTSGFLGAALHHGGLTALAGAAAIAAAGSGWFGFSCTQDQKAAAAEAQQLRQVEIANLNLQTGLERLRDETQDKVEQLRAERDRLRVRVGALEQQLASLRPPPRQPQPAPPSQQTSRAAPAATAAPIPRARQLAPTVARAVPRTKNFTTPQWVPDFFAGESERFRQKRASAETLRKYGEEALRHEPSPTRRRCFGNFAPAGGCPGDTSAGAGS